MGEDAGGDEGGGFDCFIWYGWFTARARDYEVVIWYGVERCGIPGRSIEEDRWDGQLKHTLIINQSMAHY